jgi:hypothetical protein
MAVAQVSAGRGTVLTQIPVQLLGNGKGGGEKISTALPLKNNALFFTSERA